MIQLYDTSVIVGGAGQGVEPRRKVRQEQGAKRDLYADMITVYTLRAANAAEGVVCPVSKAGGVGACGRVSTGVGRPGWHPPMTARSPDEGA